MVAFAVAVAGLGGAVMRPAWPGTLDRYLARTVLGTALVALLVLYGVDLLFVFAEQLEALGQGAYHLGAALEYIALVTPARLYQLLPMALLLGGLLGVGALVDSGELIAMRAAGVSVARLSRVVLLTALGALLVGGLLGEGVAPQLEQRADRQRLGALSGQVSLRSEGGFWARDQQRIVSIQEVRSGSELREVRVYEFAPDRSLRRLVQARSAEVRAGEWVLNDVRLTSYGAQGLRIERRARESWGSLLSPALIRLVVSRPDQLSAPDLWRYIRYQEANGLDADDYRLMFWQRLVAPLGGAAMLLFALPFVFAPQRSLTMGHRLLLGVLGGLAFHLLARGIGQATQLAGLAPWLGAVVPLLLVGGIGLAGLARVR